MINYVNKMKTKSITKKSNCWVRLKRLKIREIEPIINSKKVKLDVDNLSEESINTISRFLLKDSIAVGNAPVLVSDNAGCVTCATNPEICKSIQDYIFPKVYVKPTGERGLGLFAGENIESNTVIGEYVGEILTHAEIVGFSEI